MQKYALKFLAGLEMIIVAGWLLALPGAAQQLANRQLAMTAHAPDGSYELSTRGTTAHTVLRAGVAARIDGKWVRSKDYPQHQADESAFNDALGSGRQVAVTCSGLEGTPDMIYTLQVYDQRPYVAVQVELRNPARAVRVQAIRSLEAAGQPLIDLSGRDGADRVLSDSFSEDWPVLALYDLGSRPGGMHRGVGSQLIYNREGKQALFVGALSADRLLTILHLGYQGAGDGAKVASFTVDSSGTTEIMKENNLRRSPAEDVVELSLPLAPGRSMKSERVMLQAGADYLGQLSAYGEAIKVLHQARVTHDNLIGWWSWTSYYMAINEGVSLTNAQWQAAHLKQLGFQYFHIDEGYQYARGEYDTTNTGAFPNGMRPLGDEIRRLGLTFGIWTAPFEVSDRAWVWEHHKDWLVHTADGKPITIGRSSGNGDALYTLDTTNPDAQEYLRQTYRTLTRDWGIRYIKLDFMDTTAIEGYHYKPDTTALEAQRLGLEIIRKAVGDDVVLDKDGSPMMTPVGLVDAGRISADTAHNFANALRVIPGIAARFYMNRNWFINDPDAFNLCDKSPVPRERPGDPTHPPMTLSEAQVTIMLATVSGGMYELGDDLPTLGSEKDRLALVTNRDVMAAVRLSKSFTPLDLLSYDAEDIVPSVFFLREDQRQSLLAVFNWTEKPRSHTLTLARLGLPAGRNFQTADIFHGGEQVAIESGAIHLDNQPPHSVRVIKFIDRAIPSAAPKVTAQVPTAATIGVAVQLAAKADAAGEPALAYHWDFGDGTSADGERTSHAFTMNGDFNVRLTVDGMDGVPFQETFRVKVTGSGIPLPEIRKNQRYSEPSDR